MRFRILIPILFIWLGFVKPIPAQETGPLMMNVEVATTLGGMLGGAAVGFVVWLTDPGNPNTTVAEHVKSGCVLGILVGSIVGYYVLYQAAITPEEPPTIDDLLGQRMEQEEFLLGYPKKVSYQQENHIDFFVMRYKF